MLITFRPEFQPPWTSHPHVTTLTLSRLGLRQGADLVARVTGEKPLPAEIVEQIVARTDGVPLFVEELTKTVVETGEASVPVSLHDSLTARLDRHPEVKEIAQIAAVLGREFNYAILAAVANRPASELQAALGKLAQAELIFRRGTFSDARYTFKHALVRDAAYQSLLKARRRQVHARIADALADAGNAPPELRARVPSRVVV